MTKEEALRLALEAMKINNKAWKLLADSGDAGNWEAEEQGYYQLNEQAINAIKEALETKDEPFEYWNAVGWFGYDTGLRLGLKQTKMMMALSRCTKTNNNAHGYGLQIKK